MSHGHRSSSWNTCDKYTINNTLPAEFLNLSAHPPPHLIPVVLSILNTLLVVCSVESFDLSSNRSNAPCVRARGSAGVMALLRRLSSRQTYPCTTSSPSLVCHTAIPENITGYYYLISIVIIQVFLLVALFRPCVSKITPSCSSDSRRDRRLYCIHYKGLFHFISYGEGGLQGRIMYGGIWGS